MSIPGVGDEEQKIPWCDPQQISGLQLGKGWKEIDVVTAESKPVGNRLQLMKEGIKIFFLEDTVSQTLQCVVAKPMNDNNHRQGTSTELFRAYIVDKLSLSELNSETQKSFRHRALEHLYTEYERLGNDYFKDKQATKVIKAFRLAFINKQEKSIKTTEDELVRASTEVRVNQLLGRSSHFFTLNDEGKMISDMFTDSLPDVYSIQPYLPGSSLPMIDFEIFGNKTKIVEIINRVSSLKDIMVIGRDILNDLLKLHLNGFVHRDIKEDNFMFDGKQASLIDFDNVGKPKTPMAFSDSYTLINPRYFKQNFDPFFVEDPWEHYGIREDHYALGHVLGMLFYILAPEYATIESIESNIKIDIKDPHDVDAPESIKTLMTLLRELLEPKRDIDYSYENTLEMYNCFEALLTGLENKSDVLPKVGMHPMWDNGEVEPQYCKRIDYFKRLMDPQLKESPIGQIVLARWTIEHHKRSFQTLEQIEAFEQKGGEVLQEEKDRVINLNIYCNAMIARCDQVIKRYYDDPKLDSNVPRITDIHLEVIKNMEHSERLVDLPHEFSDVNKLWRDWNIDIRDGHKVQDNDKPVYAPASVIKPTVSSKFVVRSFITKGTEFLLKGVAGPVYAVSDALKHRKSHPWRGVAAVIGGLVTGLFMAAVGGAIGMSAGGAAGLIGGPAGAMIGSGAGVIVGMSLGFCFGFSSGYKLAKLGIDRFFNKKNQQEGEGGAQLEAHEQNQAQHPESVAISSLSPKQHQDHQVDPEAMPLLSPKQHQGQQGDEDKCDVIPESGTQRLVCNAFRLSGGQDGHQGEQTKAEITDNASTLKSKRVLTR